MMSWGACPHDAHARVLGGKRCEGAGADDFLPVLIYVVVHAAPPQLASNLEYIQRFRMQSRMASESAYFFTQLVGRCVQVGARTARARAGAA